MAWFSQENAFLDAIRNGEDSHMKSASLVFKDKWLSLAEPGCTQIINGSRCGCVEHNQLRNISKSITFGLAYGLTFIGLAERLQISRSEAQKLMEDFFNTFPKLKIFLDASANEGMTTNKIVGELPTKRIRFYHPPENEGERQAIGRESRNYKLQASNADMLKMALIKLRRYILENNYPAKLHLPIHDEILSSCPKDKSEEWSKIQAQMMQEAADMFIEPGLLKTDTKILKKWTK